MKRWNRRSERKSVKSARKAAAQILFYLGLILLWEMLFRLQIWPDYLFPSPRGVWDTLVRGFADRSFPVGIAGSLKRIAVGYTVSVIGGTVIGFLTTRAEWVDNTLGALVRGLQTLPSICWLPAAILWFGLSDAAILFVVIIGSLLAIAIATHDGIKNLPPIYLRSALTLGTRPLRIYTEVILPGALPAIVSGMKQGWSFAWRSLMAGELLFVTIGLGQLLQMGRDLNDIRLVAAVMVVIIAIGLLMDGLVFTPIEKRVRFRWGLTSH